MGIEETWPTFHQLHRRALRPPRTETPGAPHVALADSSSLVPWFYLSAFFAVCAPLTAFVSFRSVCVKPMRTPVSSRLGNPRLSLVRHRKSWHGYKHANAATPVNV